MSDWIDLSQPLSSDLKIYQMEDYSDPPFKIDPWSSLSKEGFSVFQLSLGTQTGTHMDSPSHFISGGKTVDQLHLGASIGPYFFIDIEAYSKDAAILEQYNQENILFLQNKNQIPLELSQFVSILQLKALVLIIHPYLPIANEGPLKAHQVLHEHGKFLIEGLSEKANSVNRNGEMASLPLPLIGASGSPIRVLVKLSP